MKLMYSGASGGPRKGSHLIKRDTTVKSLMRRSRFSEVKTQPSGLTEAREDAKGRLVDSAETGDGWCRYLRR